MTPATVNHFAFDGPVLTMNVELLDAIPGDFDSDGQLTADDVDALSVAIRSGENDLTFDLEMDGIVNNTDRVVWVEELAGTFFGDADLNGEVAFADFVRLSSNFDREGGWALVDFDGDGQIAFADFVQLSASFGQARSVISPVPEPTCGIQLLVIFGIAASHKIRRRRQVSLLECCSPLRSR